MTESVRVRTSPPTRSPKPLHRWLVSGCLFGLILMAGIWVFHSGNPFHRPSVRVGFNQFPPYLSRGLTKVPAGFAAEMFIQAAENAGVDIHWVEITGSADQAFEDGKADLYPLMTITPERESRFYMSAPWWENQFALISTEGRAITGADGARGKVIATRIGVIQSLSQKLFPQARFVNIQTLDEMERALCTGSIDGFFSDIRLLQGQLLQRTAGCAGQALHLTSIPDSKLLLGTASTKAAASMNDRLFREIAKLALDGTLSRSASRFGIYAPYDTARLRQVVDAEAHSALMTRVLIAALLVLTLSVIQTGMVRRAKRAAESAQAEAKELQNRFDGFMKHTPAINFIKDEQHRVIYSNEPVRDVPPISEQLTRGDDEVFGMGKSLESTETVRGFEGESRHFLVLKFPFAGAAGARYLGGVALDMTARVLAEKELEYHAKSDMLTGLPNRRSFMNELESAIAWRSERSERLAVGFLDLDGFKRVNDLFGHETGDELLVQVAGRLSRFFCGADVVARLGGDEFTFFFREMANVNTRQIMSDVLEAMEERFFINGRAVSVSACIGISLFPDHGADSGELLRNADAAMYLAKKKGKRRVEFWSPLSCEASGVTATTAAVSGVCTF